MVPFLLCLLQSCSKNLGLTIFLSHSSNLIHPAICLLIHTHTHIPPPTMANVFANFQQKMNSLRIEADENASKAEELKTKVKSLEQDNLQKEQEITSLNHRNQLLESEVEKLETGVKEAKALAGESAGHSTQNEALQRKLQVLEEEAEGADKTMRETNEK